MRKLKTGIILLLTVLLITALALMPNTVAFFTDLTTNKSAGSASIQPVALTFGADRASEPGYMLRRLAMEQRMTSLFITAEQASMTEEEVYTAAETGMDIYVESGLFQWFDVTSCTAEPCLGIDPNDQSNNAIFWVVSFTAETDPYHLLLLHIDDETGKILYIQYLTEGADQPAYAPENQRLMMDGLTHSFLFPLNLNLSEYENLLSMNVQEPDLSDDVTCVRYSYEDAKYGWIHVEFYIIPSGFYVYFPK